MVDQSLVDQFGGRLNLRLLMSIVDEFPATKGAIGQMTMAFSNDWASKGGNVYAIAPGYFRTVTKDLRNNPDRNESILNML